MDKIHRLAGSNTLNFENEGNAQLLRQETKGKYEHMDVTNIGAGYVWQ